MLSSIDFNFNSASLHSTMYMNIFSNIFSPKHYIIQINKIIHSALDIFLWDGSAMEVHNLGLIRGSWLFRGGEWRRGARQCSPDHLQGYFAPGDTFKWDILYKILCHNSFRVKSPIQGQYNTAGIRFSPGGVLPYISYIGTFRQSGYHFQGPLSWTGHTISHLGVLNRVIPTNILLSFPSDHIIFADSLRLRWNAWKRKLICTVLSVLNTACLVQSWTG